MHVVYFRGLSTDVNSSSVAIATLARSRDFSHRCVIVNKVASGLASAQPPSDRRRLDGLKIVKRPRNCPDRVHGP